MATISTTTRDNYATLNKSIGEPTTADRSRDDTAFNHFNQNNSIIHNASWTRILLTKCCIGRTSPLIGRAMQPIDTKMDRDFIHFFKQQQLGRTQKWCVEKFLAKDKPSKRSRSTQKHEQCIVGRLGWKNEPSAVDLFVGRIAAKFLWKWAWEFVYVVMPQRTDSYQRGVCWTKNSQAIEFCHRLLADWLLSS